MATLNVDLATYHSFLHITNECEYFVSSTTAPCVTEAGKHPIFLRWDLPMYAGGHFRYRSIPAAINNIDKSPVINGDLLSYASRNANDNVESNILRPLHDAKISLVRGTVLYTKVLK